MRALEVTQARDLAFLFFVRGATKFGRHILWRVGVSVGVDTDDRQLAGVLERFVVHTLFLNFAALIACFHGTQHTAAFGDTIKLLAARLPRPGRSARR